MQIKITQLGNAIKAETDTINFNMQKIMRKAVDKASKEAKNEIKRNAKFKNRTGKYRKSLSIKKTLDTRYAYEKTIYAADPHYRLTHLLENGHRIVTRGGAVVGKTRAFPHLKSGEKYAQRRLIQLITEDVDGLN